MHAKSHCYLGKLLIHQYLHNAPRRYRQAFLIGCLEPDKNPFTYLKGSFRCQWFHGHHWPNSMGYIRRLCCRFEKKSKFCLPDYYALGKLIHYVSDAFTFCHNDPFPGGLAAHRHYERILHRCWKQRNPFTLPEIPELPRSVADMVVLYHDIYRAATAHPATDCAFVMQVCCRIMDTLVDPRFSPPLAGSEAAV